MQRLTSTPHSFLRGIAGVSGLPRCLSTKAQTPKQPKARGDNEYVKRRLIYRYDLHDRRIAIKDELNEARTDDSAREEEQRRQRTAASQMREERKRLKTEERLRRAEVIWREIAERKANRKTRAREIWERREKDMGVKRVGNLQRLIEASKDWVREETLDEHVQRVLDEFFIEEERRGGGNEGKVNVVGW